MHTTLAIIDVQPKFSAAEEILDQVVHQIKLARRRSDGIVLVELGGPQSHDEIYQALHGYDKFVVANKNSSDGSREVIDAIYNNKYALDRVRVCGVNTCACVFFTLKGLMALRVFKCIEIAGNAINCMCNRGCRVLVEELVEEYKL